MDERSTDPRTSGETPPQPPVPRIGKDGKPVYDKRFFLALARCGKDEWNRWRASDPDIQVTFKDVDFRQDGNVISFASFRFGNGVDFSGATFGDRFNLSGATFGDNVNFAGATFGDLVNLFGTTFGDEADFTGATFGSTARLNSAAFGNRAILAGAIFGNDAHLDRTTFGLRADFSGAVFGDGARFNRGIFAWGPNFSGVTFGESASFSGATFYGNADFTTRAKPYWEQTRLLLAEKSPARHVRPQKREGTSVVFGDEPSSAGPDTFLVIHFSKARFLGFADFSGRKFKDKCDMTGARFHQPPSFHAGDGLDRLDLYGARISFSGRFYFFPDHEYALLGFQFTFPPREFELPTPGWTADSEVANRLRRLRDLADTTKNHDLDRDLFIEERKAERGILLAQYRDEGWTSFLRPKLYSHCLWIAVISAHSLFTDSSRSFVRPLVAMAVSVFVFYWAYSAVLIPPTDANKLEDFRRAAWAFTISNAVPFVGALTLERDVKLTLLCGDRPIDKEHAKTNEPICVPIPGRRFQLLTLGQSIFSALCIFFAGLALRNYFKLR